MSGNYTRFIVAAVIAVAVTYATDSPQAGFTAFSLVPSIGYSLDASEWRAQCAIVTGNDMHARVATT